MKAYVTTTGALFGLLVLVHVWRGIQEPHLAKDPWFIFFTFVAAGLTFWAWRLFQTAART